MTDLPTTTETGIKTYTCTVCKSTKKETLPVISVEGNIVTVTVGSVEHPMLEVHYIAWIILETRQGRQRKTLNPGEKPVAKFALTEGDEVVAAYEYCNLHGLWSN